MAATTGDDTRALMFGGNPISQTAKAIGRVEGMTADGTRQPAVSPDSEVRSEPFVQLGRHAHDESGEVVNRAGRIHPWKVLPQVLPVPLDSVKKRFGVLRLKLLQFEIFAHHPRCHTSFILRSSRGPLGITRLGEGRNLGVHLRGIV